MVKLLRTDTTLDLSQKARVVKFLNSGAPPYIRNGDPARTDHYRSREKLHHENCSPAYQLVLMSLSNRIFSACSADFLDNSNAGASTRATKRILINADILKNAKVFAGDLIAITAAESGKVCGTYCQHETRSKLRYSTCCLQ